MDNQINVANPMSTPSPVGAAPMADIINPPVQNPLQAASAVTPDNPVGIPQPAMPTVGTSAGMPQPPSPARPAPSRGSFGEKLLSAIGGVLQGLSKAESNLGDAADPNGTGPLSGIEQTMARQNARIEEQKRYDAAQKQKEQERQDKLTQEQRIQQREDAESQARIALSNTQNLAAKQATYHLGNEYMDKQIAQETHDFKSITGEGGAEGLAQVIQSNVTGDQKNALLQEGKINPATDTSFATGKKQDGVDANGNPRYALTYDIVRVPETWTPTDNQIERIKTVPGYEKYQKGTVMPGSQILAALRQAEVIRTTQDMTDAARVKAGLDKQTLEQQKDFAQFNKNGDWLRYLNTYKGDAISAATHMLADPAMAKKYSTGLYNDVIGQFASKTDPSGAENFNKAVHERNMEGIERIKAANAGLQQLPGGGAMTDQMKMNVANLPADKQAIIEKLDSPTQASLYSIAFGPGDLSIDTFPNRVSGKSGQVDRNHAIGIIRQLNPNWSEQQYKQMQAAYKQITFGRNGQDVQTYNNLLGHMANAQDIIENSLRSKNPKFLNSVINLAEKEGWGTEATKIQTALEPVKTEFESLMNNGHALHADQQKLYDAMVNPAMTPAQLEAAFKNFGATGIIRLMGLNDQYKKIAGNNLPGILRKESVEAAKHLNLDAQTQKLMSTLNTGDTLFHNAQWTPGTPQEQQQFDATAQQQQQAAATALSPEHVVFDSRAWAAAHPGKDVNAAIAFAKSKGYEVK